MKFSLAVLTLVSSALAAYVPSEPWSTLTPQGEAHSCAATEYQSTFGIAISTVTEEIEKRGLATQVEDGQIQHTTGTAPIPTIATTSSEKDITITEKKTVTVTHPDVIVTQIGDGQIQAPNPTPKVTDIPVTVDHDGKKSVSISYSSLTSTSSYSYRPQSSKSASAKPTATNCPAAPIAHSATCKAEGDLTIVLKNGILYDSKNRIGSIVSNHQFQFDGPVPQAGAIYAAGWSIQDGKLALGGSTTFYECLSGTFYNLYDEKIAEQCSPVVLNVIDLVDC
ncbi:hypothetical protein CANINC_002471 [Pichia inconspicua]|uniref:Cell wall mannoprotein PIR1-like C-terminal domain-containing protein n=1 Tax=Pichia inconspicua TaxID=52247 RepID=A0A4T0X178_9ASCO|nr:hypothetical protein CANINC_002471 [[Candida] inconspicua]